MLAGGHAFSMLLLPLYAKKVSTVFGHGLYPAWGANACAIILAVLLGKWAERTNHWAPFLMILACSAMELIFPLAEPVFGLPILSTLSGLALLLAGAGLRGLRASRQHTSGGDPVGPVLGA